jgi:hypothetical protein
MAYTLQRDFDEAIKSLKTWGGEYSTAQLSDFRVVAKARLSRKSV